MAKGNNLAKIAKGVKKMNPVTSAISTIDEILDCIKVREVEKTKRKAIEAQRDVLITHLQDARRFAEKLIDKEYERREKSFDRLFKLLDKIIDNPQVSDEHKSRLIVSITELAIDSPIPKIMAAHRDEVDREIATGKIEL